jgi:hypothetical protein
MAAVISYARSHFGNHHKDQITAAEVGRSAQVRVAIARYLVKKVAHVAVRSVFVV